MFGYILNWESFQGFLCLSSLGKTQERAISSFPKSAVLCSQKFRG